VIDGNSSSAWRRAWPLAAAASLLLTSCQRIEPTIVVNLTSKALAIRYFRAQRENSAGERDACLLRDPLPRGRPGVDRARSFDEWEPVTDAKLDFENCTAELTIPPRSMVWIATNGTCEDDERALARNPELRPVIQSLMATQDGREMRLEGWDVVRAFKRESGTCALEIDAKMLTKS
jgi:hypothetical protein